MPAYISQSWHIYESLPACKYNYLKHWGDIWVRNVPNAVSGVIFFLIPQIEHHRKLCLSVQINKVEGEVLLILSVPHTDIRFWLGEADKKGVLSQLPSG